MFYKCVWINRLSKDLFENRISAAEMLTLANSGITRSSFFWLGANLKKTLAGVDHIRYGIGVETADGLETSHCTTYNFTYGPQQPNELLLKTGFLKDHFKDFAWVKLQSDDETTRTERLIRKSQESNNSADKPYLTCWTPNYFEIGLAFAELKQEIKLNHAICLVLAGRDKKELQERLAVDRALQDAEVPKTVDVEAYLARREEARSMRGMYLDQAHKPSEPKISEEDGEDLDNERDLG